MTAYAYNHGGHRFLWADTDDEALILAAAIGHDLTQPPWAWSCYRLTEDQWLDALVAGAEPTDRFGPAYSHGDHKTKRAIERARTMGCVPA